MFATNNISKEAIPVTVLVGFLGSGKTTLLNHILNNQQGYKIAVLVNDMSEINIDGKKINQGGNKDGNVLRPQEKIVELSNGCICCQLREDLRDEIRNLSTSKKFDYILVESSGISEPLPIAMSFVFNDNKCLSDCAKLDSIVTVVDAFNFFDNLSSLEETLIVRQQVNLKQMSQKVNKKKQKQKLKDQEKNKQLVETGQVYKDKKTISELMIEQLEFTNIVVINKADKQSKKNIKQIELLIKKLNPKCRIVISTFGQVDPKSIFNQQLFDLKESMTSPGWALALEEWSQTPLTPLQEYGIYSFVYYRAKPFHPERFKKLFLNLKWWQDIVRLKGWFWIANASMVQILVEKAGPLFSVEQDRPWMHYMISNHKQLKIGKDLLKQIQEDIQEQFKSKNMWDATYGDRRQEVVFIGMKMNQEKMIKDLDECLLTDAEFKKGQNWWDVNYKDIVSIFEPFKIN